MDNHKLLQRKIQDEARKIRIEPSDRLWQQLRTYRRRKVMHIQRVWQVAAVGLICILCGLLFWTNGSDDLDRIDLGVTTETNLSADHIRFIQAAYASNISDVPKNRTFRQLRVKEIGGSL